MKRSKHSLSHTVLLTCDMGELIPCGLVEVLPGDSIQQATFALVRAAPILAPVMHPVVVSISHWFVPHRLVWDDFEKFITGGPDGMDASIFPTRTLASCSVGSLADYLGIPTAVTYSPGLSVSALPFRAYLNIWNEWFRDQDLQAEVSYSTASGVDAGAYPLQNVSWGKDYFTSARPWEQKGPAITIPIGNTAPVTGIYARDTRSFANAPANLWGTKPGDDPATGSPATISAGSDNVYIKGQSNNPASGTARPQIFADLTNASAVTVTALRQALALQRYEEARARYGSRYTEYLQYLGVRSSDGRLQRPEYLGGGKETISFSEVLQTAEGTKPVGTLRGHGISSLRSNRYRRFFEEHGYILSLLHVRPRSIYASGVARHWNRRTKEDFWQRELEYIGQQKVKNKEVYAAHATPDGTFGYSDRYAEYRSEWSRISGEYNTTQNFWHFARVFASAPALNADFIKCVPTEVPFAVPSEDVLQIQVKHSIQARRLVSKRTDSFIH